MKHKQTLPSILCISTICIAITSSAMPQPAARDEILRDLVVNADRTYKTIRTPDKKYGVRSIFTSMLAYAEANTNLTRIAEFMVKAEALQERNPDNRSYGNLYWYSTESEVHDQNAVDFCMQHAMLLWRFHHDKLDTDTQKRLYTIITLGLHGLKFHHPRATYTNIALLNASDLILLGETLHNQAAIDEGNRRLNVFLKTLWEQGVHEYVSSTYYGVDLEAMTLLHALSDNHSTRQTAAVILNLFWQDIALNWNSKAEILSGTNSRTYDYLYNRGELDQMLVASGWLPRPSGRNRKYFQYRIFTPLYANVQLPASLYQLSSTQYPRNVQQRFGDTHRSARTHYLYKDITLSTSGCIYGGRMDMPLTVDLPLTRSELKPRTYFIPDGRNDPYGKKRIEAGNHSKALHLSPWWAATQHKTDAIGVVLYTDNILKEIAEGLQSHIVFRKDLDDLYLDNKKLDINKLKASPCKVSTNQSVFLRKGYTVTAIQIPWAQGQNATPASISIIDDDNKYGALRLSVSHPVQKLEEKSGLETAGAAFRVKIGSGLESNQAFSDFRDSFISTAVTVKKESNKLRISCSGEMPLTVEVDSLTAPAGALLSPPPTSAVLALDGHDIGREILERSPVIQEYVKNKTTMVPITIVADKPTTWSALKGGFTVPIEKANEGEISYLWSPEMEGTRHGNNGKIEWQLNVSKAGSYLIEAEILAPTPEDDSFFVSAVDSSGNPVLSEFAWSTGTGKEWRWSTVINRDSKPYKQHFNLPAGEINLIFRTREAGIKLSRLRLTPQ